jgi:chemotaxis protein methyltransferase CheR
MTDQECEAFLQFALPRLGLRWKGFRHLRGQVCKRIARRIAHLGLADVAAYCARLEADPAEWGALDALCIVTISRFYRDRAVWDALHAEVLPTLAATALAERDEVLRCWSIGCASGEEPYTLSILWKLGLAPRFPGLRLHVLATDIDDRVLQRARAATYPPGTLRELPAHWRAQAFQETEDSLQLRETFRAPVELRQEDARHVASGREYRLMLCRNVLCTYVAEELQSEMLARLLSRLSTGGAFVIGRHERLPGGIALEPWFPSLGIYRHVPQ